MREGPFRWQHLRQAVAAAIDDGADLDEVEALLAAEPLSDDERDALWLYAWGRSERGGDEHRGPRPTVAA